MTFDFPGMKLDAVQTPSERLAEVLAELGAPVKVAMTRRGPRVDSHEVIPAGPTTVAKLRRACADVAARLVCPSATLTIAADGKLYVDVARADPDFPLLSQISATRAPYEVLLGVGLGGDEVKLDLRAAAQVLVGSTTGCLHGDTPIHDPVDGTTKTVRERWAAGVGFHVWSLDPRGNPVVTAAMPPHQYLAHQMMCVTLSNGEQITVTPGHRFWDGSQWVTASDVHERLRGPEPVLLPTSSGSDLRVHAQDAFHWSRTTPGSLVDCRPGLRSDDERPLGEGDVARESTPSRDGAPERTSGNQLLGGQETAPECTLSCRRLDPPSRSDFGYQGSLDHDSAPDKPEVPAQPSGESPPAPGQLAMLTSLSGTCLRQPAAALESMADSEAATCHEYDGTQPQPRSPRTSLQCPSRKATESRTSTASSPHARGSNEADHTAGQTAESTRSGRSSPFGQDVLRFQESPLDATGALPNPSPQFHATCSTSSHHNMWQSLGYAQHVRVIKIEPVDAAPYYDFHVPVCLNYWAQGVWHHNSGKSTLLRSLLQDLVRRHDQHSLRVVIGDPKGVEMEDFRGHPCILDVVQEARRMRDWIRATQEHMVERYARMKTEGLRSAYDANMPPILMVIDEFTAFRFAEQTWHASAGTGATNSMEGVLDLLERGRAAGIHLILATQNPVVSAVPGRLKACMPTRVALRVATRVNSQVILDQSGAEALLGRGDALLSHNGVLTRFQVPVPDVKV